MDVVERVTVAETVAVLVTVRELVLVVETVAVAVVVVDLVVVRVAVTMFVVVETLVTVRVVVLVTCAVTIRPRHKRNVRTNEKRILTFSLTSREDKTRDEARLFGEAAEMRDTYVCPFEKGASESGSTQWMGVRLPRKRYSRILSVMLPFWVLP